MVLEIEISSNENFCCSGATTTPVGILHDVQIISYELSVCVSEPITLPFSTRIC